MPFSHFAACFSVLFLLICTCLDMSPWLNVYVANISFLSVACICTLLMVSLDVQFNLSVFFMDI